MNLFLKLFSFILVISLLSPVFAEDKKTDKLVDSNLVKVYISSTGEEESIELKYSQLATVKVYLASYGDMLDKFMVSLFDMNNNKLIANQLSGVDGVVVFRKIPAGHYSVYVNTRVKEDGEIFNVKVADVVLSKF